MLKFFLWKKPILTPTVSRGITLSCPLDTKASERAAIVFSPSLNHIFTSCRVPFRQMPDDQPVSLFPVVMFTDFSFIFDHHNHPCFGVSAYPCFCIIFFNSLIILLIVSTQKMRTRVNDTHIY